MRHLIIFRSFCLFTSLSLSCKDCAFSFFEQLHQRSLCRADVSTGTTENTIQTVKFFLKTLIILALCCLSHELRGQVDRTGMCTASAADTCSFCICRKQCVLRPKQCHQCANFLHWHQLQQFHPRIRDRLLVVYQLFFVTIRPSYKYANPFRK